DRGLSWFFEASTWTVAWHALDRIATIGESEVMVLRSGGEAYRFGFRDPAEITDFMQGALRAREHPPTPTSAGGPDARGTLSMLVVLGVVGALLGAGLA